MNIGNVFLWGFAGTIVLSTLMSASRPLGLSRMDLPFFLGTMSTGNRNKAPWLGFLFHVAIGWIFAFLYAWAFESTGWNTWWFGMGIAVVHAAFVLTVGLEALTFFHPRMARPADGPSPTRQLQPPGFFALHYGRGTPLVTLVAHLAYGLILGIFY